MRSISFKIYMKSETFRLSFYYIHDVLYTNHGVKPLKDCTFNQLHIYFIAFEFNI